MMVPMEDMSTTQERTSRPKKGATITRTRMKFRALVGVLCVGWISANQVDSKAKDDAARGSECQIDHMSGMPEDGKVAD